MVMFLMDAKMKKNKPQVLDKLMISAFLSSGLAIVMSLTTILLCMLAFIYKYQCYIAELPMNGADYFIITLLKVYILSGECKYSLQTYNLTTSDSIFIFVIILTVFCFIHVFSAVGMVAVLTHEEPPKWMDISIFIYIGASLAVLVVDLTLGVHFGMDYAEMQQQLSLNSPALAMNYEMDMIRLGSLLLMSVALKGYIGHAANIVLLVLLTIYVNRYRRCMHRIQHSIHNLRPLQSFEVPKSRVASEDSWTTNRNDINLTYVVSAHTNPEFNGGEPSRQRGPMQENPLSNRKYEPSNPWSNESRARPFSYLDVPKQHVPVKLTPLPANDPNWRRELWAESTPIPEPDYSPPIRRLKSALKG